MLPLMPMLPEWYGSEEVKKAANANLQQRKLNEEEYLLGKTAELLEKLAEADPTRYPQLPVARELLCRKQAERLLMEAWSRWHDDSGDPTSAAQVLETFLQYPDANLAFDDPNDPEDPILVYAANLMTALIDHRGEYPFQFEEKQLLPTWLENTLLGSYLRKYKELYEVQVDFASGNLKGSVNAAQQLAEEETTPAWLKPLAYELWIEVISNVENKFRDLLEISDSWCYIWPDGNPLLAARQLEGQDLWQRASRIRSTLGMLAFRYYKSGQYEDATRILGLFTEEERQKTERPSSRGLSLEQLWTFLQQPDNSRDYRLVLELDYTDEDAIENWIQTQDPYAKWGERSKAVLITARLEPKFADSNYKKTNDSLNTLLDKLRVQFSEDENTRQYLAATVEKFRRSFPTGQSDDLIHEWIWLTPIPSLGALAFAVELGQTMINKTLSFTIHTLIELDPVDPTARYVDRRDAIRRVNRNDPDLVILKKIINDQVNNSLYKEGYLFPSD